MAMQDRKADDRARFIVYPNGVVCGRSWRDEGCTGEARHEIKLDVPAETTPEIVAAALNLYHEHMKADPV